MPFATAPCPTHQHPDCAARLQFHNLEQWMASPSALQLPLHQVEQQQDPKGREVQRLLLQAHVQLRELAMSDRLWPSLSVNRSSCSLTAACNAERSKPSSARSTLIGSVMVAGATIAFIRSTRICRCQSAPSPTDCRGDWSRLPSRVHSAKRLRESSTPPD